ncbi:hypothetical protein ACWD6I_15575 [Streptomyces sp. NPDC002454]
MRVLLGPGRGVMENSVDDAPVAGKMKDKRIPWKARVISTDLAL